MIKKYKNILFLINIKYNTYVFLIELTYRINLLFYLVLSMENKNL